MKIVRIEKEISECNQCPHYHFGAADEDSPPISVCTLTNKKHYHSVFTEWTSKSNAPNWYGEKIPIWCPLPNS